MAGPSPTMSSTAGTPPGHDESDSIFDSAARRPPPIAELSLLVASRDLLRELIRRNVVVMYKRSVLGILWSILHPLLLLGSLVLVFSTVFRSAVPHFVLHVFAGLLVWTFFSQATSWAMNDFVMSGALLRRVRVPANVFACAAVGTGLVNLATSFPVLIGMAILDGAPIGWGWAALPFAILCLAAFTLGVSLLLSTAVAYFADVAEMYRVVQLVWLFLTPIFYPLEVLPENVRAWLWLNPLIPILETFRAPLVTGDWPPLAPAIQAAGLAAVFLVAGWLLFAHKTDDLVYRV